jgi:hypothetical protein
VGVAWRGEPTRTMAGRAPAHEGVQVQVAVIAQVGGSTRGDEVQGRGGPRVGSGLDLGGDLHLNPLVREGSGASDVKVEVDVDSPRGLDASRLAAA